MKSNVNITNTLNLLCEMEHEKVKFQILEYEDLRGSSDINSAVMLSYMRSANIRLRQVKLVLRNASAYVERGSLSYMRGNLEVTSNTGGPTGIVKKLITSSMTGEHFVKPLYRGSGEILLEPSFNHYIMLELEEDEEIIVDDKMFFAAEGTVKLTARMVNSVSGAVLGGERLFQTSLVGPGLAVLEVPVPEEEIFKYRLNEDTLKVDGSFVFLRTQGIDFTVERTTSSLIGSNLSGEGFLQVFRGTGEVWLMQTKQVYEEISNLDNPLFHKEAGEGSLKIEDEH